MKQIIAMGGGGFSMEPDNHLLDTYVLEQASVHKPKICFLPTASGDAEGYIERFYNFFENQPCVPNHFSLFKPATRDIRGFLLEQDIIYVGGGNTKNMLALWREWGLDNILREAWERDIILAGLSAGAICWFEQGLTDSYGGVFEPIDCLGLLKGSGCPHYDGETKRRRDYHKLIESGQLLEGYALDDGAAIHFVGNSIKQVISSRPHANARYVHMQRGQIIEKTLSMEFLGE